MLSRRKQTNKKIKTGQKDVWHGSSMKCEARHATQPCLDWAKYTVMEAECEVEKCVWQNLTLTTCSNSAWKCFKAPIGVLDQENPEIFSQQEIFQNNKAIKMQLIAYSKSKSRCHFAVSGISPLEAILP